MEECYYQIFTPALQYTLFVRKSHIEAKRQS